MRDGLTTVAHAGIMRKNERLTYQEGNMTAFIRIALVAGICASFAGSAFAAQCIRAGGWGTGALEGFASFMAEAAMKNSAKAKLGDAVKIGAPSTKCEIKGLLYECNASAKACK
jgi:hypothetical protein